MLARSDERIERYLNAIARELKCVATHLPRRRGLGEVHFGGGSPSLLTPKQFETLWAAITASFNVRDDAEVSIEVDPRTVDPERMASYRRAGVHRISMGFQDLDADVQAAIGRNQSAAESWRAYEWARAAGFAGINVDLCYGLPQQTEISFEHTVRQVAQLRPDRLALFGYAHVPQLKPLQRRIDVAALPDVSRRIRLFTLGRDILLAAGYRAIGIDHFALPGDPLLRALDEGKLHRNFQGYTTSSADTMVGVGLSAISDFGGALAQNHRTLPGYLEAIDAEGGTSGLATERGFVRSPDDQMRGDIIRQIMCTFGLDVAKVETTYGVTFDREFATEIADLAKLETEGLLSWERGDDAGTPDHDRGRGRNRIVLSAAGKLLARNVAMVFDAYRRKRMTKDVAPTGDGPRRLSSSI